MMMIRSVAIRTGRRMIRPSSRRARGLGHRRPAGVVESLSPVVVRTYSSTSPTLLAWWNPFSRGAGGGGGGGGGTHHVSSGKSQAASDENPRKLQERKDAILVSLAMEFRKQSLLLSRTSSPKQHMEREQVIDLAFEALEQEELDNKTQMQLRHYVQKSMNDQLSELFKTFGRVDESLPDDPDDDQTFNAVYDQFLQLELERTIDALADPNPQRAPKGPAPLQFLELKRGALETLIRRRQQEQESTTSTTTTEENTTTTPSDTTNDNDDNNDNNDNDNDGEAEQKRVTWVDADEFGYHETIDTERNRLVRHYQSVNLCRSAKMRDEWGFSVVALQSSVPGAGRGVYVDGYAKAGSILVFQPGDVWAKEHMMKLPVEVERQLEKNDNYQMSLRYDDFMIDSRKSPYTVLTEERSNLMALGHIINHPTPSRPPNCRTIMVNFTKELELGKLDRYIPNRYARPRNLGMLGSLWEGEAVDMHSMCLIATRDICNEELFYDYRLLTSQRPQWYHLVQETAFEDPVEEDKEQEEKEEKEEKEGKHKEK
jgi:hypothetical protein